ncbi:MAG: protein-glutamate O-methyltransferase CheR [Gammaproteobacteria bacterium]|nr:protein-glutamate O-methyltransferase CheR [Gammaproteobacteria bacterium]
MPFRSSSTPANSEQDYRCFREFLENCCGIVLGENKNYLIDSRLRKIVRDNEITSLTELVRKIDSSSISSLRQKVIDAMTTNETLWFRDGHPFEHFSGELLPELSEGGQPLKIWCAASSSGQEPYTISICAEEYKKRNISKPFRDVSIVATDICTEILDQAKAGEYEMLSLNRGMSNERLKRHFSEIQQGRWKINPEIQRRVEFKQFNLKDSFSTLGRFDVVFCRNVLIYFSTELQSQILRNIHSVLKPGGYLYLGGSEGPRGLDEYFKVCYYTPGVFYKKK